MRSVCNSLLSYDLNERPDIFSLSERIDKGLSEERSLLMRKNKINK